MPVSGHGHNSLGMIGDQELETTLAERVVQTLGPVVGSEHVKSSVTIDYDPTSAESTQDLYDPNNTAVLSSQSSQETVGDLEPAGIPGTPSNGIERREHGKPRRYARRHSANQSYNVIARHPQREQDVCGQPHNAARSGASGPG